MSRNVASYEHVCARCDRWRPHRTRLVGSDIALSPIDLSPSTTASENRSRTPTTDARMLPVCSLPPQSARTTRIHTIPEPTPTSTKGVASPMPQLLPLLPLQCRTHAARGCARPNAASDRTRRTRRNSQTRGSRDPASLRRCSPSPHSPSHEEITRSANLMSTRNFGSSAATEIRRCCSSSRTILCSPPRPAPRCNVLRS